MMTRAIVLALLCSCGAPLAPAAPRASQTATQAPTPQVDSPPTPQVDSPPTPQVPSRPIPVGRSRISGTVTDFITHVPMEGVLVVLASQSRSEKLAFTDDHGVYVLDGIKPGEYRLSLSYADVEHKTTLQARRGSETVFDYQFARGIDMPHPLPVEPPILPL